MEYTPAQRDIIRRIGDVNKRINEATAAQEAVQATVEAVALSGAVRALTDTMNRSAEIHRLCREHSDLFREFLDTLVED
jgi:hypothetical protein